MILCIIYEKGLKPIKDEKYYYFETPMIKKLSEFTLNHLEFDAGSRGKWRKFNPYNPYVDDDNGNNSQRDLNVESLDDLFEDDNDNKVKDDNKVENGNNEQTLNNNRSNKIENDIAPLLPQDDDNEKSKQVNKTVNNDEIMSIDVQKELEAKFDELFGSFDDDSEK